MGVGSIRFGGGSATPVVPPASWIRKYCPGSSETFGSSVSWVVLAPRFPVPVALAYWIDQPASEAVLPPRL